MPVKMATTVAPSLTSTCQVTAGPPALANGVASARNLDGTGPFGGRTRCAVTATAVPSAFEAKLMAQSANEKSIPVDRRPNRSW